MAAEAIKKRAPVFVKVNSLRPDTTGHNLKVKFLELAGPEYAGDSPKLAKCRYSLTPLRLSTATEAARRLQVVDAKVVLNRPGNKTLNTTPSRVAECTVGDETGVIVLTARNDQVDVATPGKSIVIRNAKIDMFRGSMRLAVNQWGKLEEAQEAFDFTPLTDFNLSLVEYELVPVPVAEGSSSAAAAEGSSGNGSGVAAGQDGIAAS